MDRFSGGLDATDLKLGVVVSRFNSMITEKLLAGALDTFRRHGGKEENIVVAHVPGSFEIPVAAQRLAEKGGVDAVVCLGCLIRGETAHFDFLASEVTRCLGQLSLDQRLPITYGIITSDTVEQAMNRAGIKHGNKGIDATIAALEMVNLLRSMEPQ